MATIYNDLSLISDVQATFAPQNFSSTAAGTAVLVTDIGSNYINAILNVGAVSSFTSLVVKMQASPTTTDGDFVDCDDATFTTVTAAQNVQIIGFQIPKALTTSSNPNIYVRAYATLVGTSCYMAVNVIGCKKMPNPSLSYQNSAPVIN